MSKIKKIFNSLLICFCMLSCFGLGLALFEAKPQEEKPSTNADLTEYEPVVNDLPDFIKLSSDARQSEGNLVYLMSDNKHLNINIASGDNNIIKGTGDNAGKENYAYIPNSDLNVDDPLTSDIDESKTEYYYFDISNSLSLYYNVSNTDIEENGVSQLNNLLSGRDINLFRSSKNNAFPIDTYDITPQKFEMAFALNTSLSEIAVTPKSDATPVSIVTLSDEGCYTLALTINSYHTTDRGQTFSTTSKTYYYTFFVFDYTTYFDSATELPTITMSNVTTSTLTSSETHSTYYFYNYNTNRLPAFSYSPYKEQISIHYTDTENNAYDTTIEFNPTTKEITQKDNNGNVINDEFVFATYNATSREITLTFNGLGEYDISFNFLYTSDIRVFDLPLTAKRQRLYNYGYQAFFTNYSIVDSETNTTASQEFKKFSEDKKSFENSADITYALTNPQHQQSNYSLDLLKENAKNAINGTSTEPAITPVSTNQTPVKFASNTTIFAGNKYSVTLDKNGKIETIESYKENDGKFDGLNINEPGTYLIVIDYQYSKYLSASGTVQGTYHHYQVFYFTVDNKIPSVTMLDEKGEEIHTRGFTNKSVYILDNSAATLYDAQVRITLTAENYVTGRNFFNETDITEFATTQYGITYFTDRTGIPNTTSPQTGIYIDASASNPYRNARFTVSIYSQNSKIPSKSSFTIDTNEITNLIAQNVKYSTSSTYSIVSQVSGNKTNQPIIFSWDNKASGAQTYGYYKYFKLESTNYYRGGNDDSQLLYSLLAASNAPDLLPVNAFLNLNANSNQWTQYINAKDYANTVPSTYVRDQAGLYLFEVYDEAGNASFEIYFIDNTSPLFVKRIESSASTIRSILSSNDTLTVSPSYIATIEWASNKGIYLTPYDDNNYLFQTYAQDGLDKDENGQVPALTQKLNAFLGDANTVSVLGITATPPDTQKDISSYNGKYLKIKVADNYFFQDAEDDKTTPDVDEASTYVEKIGNSYTINFFTADDVAKEGTYKFLIRDDSNANYSHNEYGFLNYPSNYLSINVTSDSSRLQVILNGNPIDSEGYSLRGNFYTATDGDGNIIYSKTNTSDDYSWSESDLTYRYAYYIPVKTENPLTVSYIPVSENDGRVTRVKSVEIVYYAYKKVPKEVTYTRQDGSTFTAVAYYYTISDTPTRTIPVFSYSDSANYISGQPNTYTLSFGSGMATEGKYVITRTYFEDSSNIDKYDYYERSLTLMVDRYNVLSVQESVTNGTNTSLESIVGGDMLVTMYNQDNQASIQVAFPYYDPETGLNTESFYTKGSMTEDSLITAKLTTNKLPLSVKIPKFKYTENYVYDYATNTYSVIENNALSRLGNGRIEEVEISGYPFYNVIVEGILAGTFDTREEAEAYLKGTEIPEYKLYAEIRYTQSTTREFYKTNGTTTGEYLNFYKVDTIDSAIPDGAQPVIFSKAGHYDVTIYQAYSGGNTSDEGSFRNFYRFAFEIEQAEPTFTVLTDNDGNNIEVNSININNVEAYYTNSKKIKIQWVDSNDRYIANTDKTITQNRQPISIVKDDGSVIMLEASDIETNGLTNSISLDLGEDGLNIWENGRFFSITMQLEGHNDEYYSKVTKYVYVDYSAPIDNLASLMTSISNSSSRFDRIYQEINTRELLDYNGDEVSTSAWRDNNLINTYMANVSYSYSTTVAPFTNYAYNVSKEYFRTLKASVERYSQTPTNVQEIYYNLIGNVEDYLTYSQVRLSSFSSLDYNNIRDLELDYNNILNNTYYEVVERDTAGNMVVYVVHIYDPENSENVALSYTNGVLQQDEEIKTVKDNEIVANGNIYSNSDFEILSLDYLADPWGIYSVTIYGSTILYMKSPYLMLDSQNEYDETITDVYQLEYENGRLTYKVVSLSQLFNNVLSSPMKHGMSFVNRYTGNVTNIYVSIMDASLTTSKVSDSTTATLNILDIPTNEQANSTTQAFIFPVEIKIYQLETTAFGDNWSVISDEVNYSGNPANWTSSQANILYSLSGNILSINVMLGTLNSQKLKYEITDNFGNVTTVIQLANEETCEEILGSDTIYMTDESDGSITYLSSNDMSYQYNRMLYEVEVERYDPVLKAFVRMQDSELYKGTYPGTQTITSIRFLKTIGNYDRVFRIKVYEAETYFEGSTDYVKVVNIRLYYRLPQTLTSSQNPEDISNIWFLDKNNEYIYTFGTINSMSVIKDGKVYTANATTINTYSSNITVFFDNGQFTSSGNRYSYLNEYTYSVYVSMDGNSWLNINEYYSSGYRITGSGNYKVLVTYDNPNTFANLCLIYDINILDSSSVFYYITVDGNLIEKSDIKYTDPSGIKHPENYIVSVNYNDKSDRVAVVGNDELNIKPRIRQTYPTGTNIYVEVWYYESSLSNGTFTIIYIGETNSILTYLNYEDASGSPISLLGKTTETVIANEVETDFTRLRISWTSYYGISENINNIEVLKLFNNEFVPVNIEVYTSGTTSYAFLTRTGTYRIRFYDSCTPANAQAFGNGEYINFVFLNSVPFTVSYIEPDTEETIVTEPINRAVYNGEVKLNLVNLSSYFQTSGYPVISVMKDGEEYTGYTLSNYVYTFSETGYYVVRFSARSLSGINIRQEDYIFSIINKNESRYAYEFSPYSNYYIEKIIKDGRDVTANIVNLAGSDVVIVNGEKYLSKLLVSYFDEKTGSGRYTITINTGEAAYRTITATKFTFGFWINLATPPVNISISEGSSTTDNITIRFNAYNLYDTVGDCYIRIASDRYVITADTLETIGGENATITITQSGTYYVQIYTTSNNLLYSYKVTKSDPLNAWAIIAIVFGVIALAVVTFITIKLRKRLKVK